jgi:Trk K+ transport system NAD-binding subunit/Kef-type K+ transport system membrane component KefB
MDLVVIGASFAFVALAAKIIGHQLGRVGLPHISGYILAGAVAGPFILGLLPEGTATDLRFVDEISLAVIAFTAGSELYLKEIRSRLRPIGAMTVGIMVITFALVGALLFLLTANISFTEGMSVAERGTVAILGATILLALSPASTIAVIREVRARGPYSRTVLGVTVTMDVVIILLFAVSVAVASALLTGIGFTPTFLLLLVIDLGAAILAGLLTGYLLRLILSLNAPRLLKTGLMLLIGYAIFASAYWLIDFSHDTLPFEIHIEPLLVAMIGGFYVTNYTPFRKELDGMLHDVGPAVYVAFFTLTGVSLKLDVLLATLPIAAALFGTRVISITLGSYAGSRLVGAPAKHSRLYWMGLITQAGIALGLAREVAVEFPTLGDAFATMIISVVVLNEIFGPLFLKLGLRRVGETRLPESVEVPDEERDVLIFGIEEQSLELARQLQTHNWRVIMADTDQAVIERLADTDIETHFLPQIDEKNVRALFGGRIDALLTMLPDDQANLQAAELAYSTLGVSRIIVRPQGLTHAARFAEINALIIDQTSAMVHLLSQSVIAPQSAALLLHQDSGREIVQITVSNPDTNGTLVRDVRLPEDVLLMDITRNGHSLVPNGYTRLQTGDEVTLLGQPESLEVVTIRLGY